MVKDPLTQEQLDDIIRKYRGDAAVEEMIIETSRTQEYRLSDGTVLVISKRTGKGRVETTSGKLVRRF